MGTQVCRHNGKIFDWSHEADLDITNNSDAIYRLYARKQDSYYVNKVTGFGLSDLSSDLIDRARKMSRIRNIEMQCMYTENANRAHGHGMLELSSFQPFAKNPAISKIFRESSLADELGSGMRNTYKYTKLYSGGTPEFIEGNIFKTMLPLSAVSVGKVGPSQSNLALTKSLAKLIEM